MLDKARAEELVDGLDLDRVFYCSACVFEVAWGDQMRSRSALADARARR